MAAHIPLRRLGAARRHRDGGALPGLRRRIVDHRADVGRRRGDDRAAFGRRRLSRNRRSQQEPALGRDSPQPTVAAVLQNRRFVMSSAAELTVSPGPPRPIRGVSAWSPTPLGRDGHPGIRSDRGAVGRHGRARRPGPPGVVLPTRRRPRRRRARRSAKLSGNPREMGRELRSILEDLAEGAAA